MVDIGTSLCLPILMIIRFLTYNIHKGIGTDRKFRLDRTISVLKESKADVISLQEVDQHVPRSRQLDLAREIAEALDMQYHLGLNVKLKRGSYGNATLSRFPIMEKHNQNITWGIKKRRGCLITRLKVGRKNEIVIFNLHLGLAAFEQRWQMKKILSGRYYKKFNEMPLIVLGDTNDRRHKLTSILELAGFEDSCQTRGKRRDFTWPAYAPVVRLDKLYFNDSLNNEHHHVPRTKLSRIASDHLPLIVDLKLNNI